MGNRLVMTVGVWVAMIGFTPALHAQQPAAPADQSSNIPDLSGPWTRGQGGFGSSLSLSDPRMQQRGHEDDIPYQDWAREKTLSERTSTGPEAQYWNSTNPQMWCDPVGAPAVYGWPAKTEFVQTPKAVYILYEYGISFRIVWLNGEHPEDPDPQWWGHSIGWYENGDTLVIDTVGLNDRVWLDEAAHPQTEQMHMIERYKRVDADTMRLDLTLDDPGAYTRPWHTFRNFRRSDSQFMEYGWACTVREVQAHTDELAAPALNPGTPAENVSPDVELGAQPAETP